MREYYYTLAGIILVCGFYLESDCHLAVGILIIRLIQSIMIHVIAREDITGVIEGVVLTVSISFFSAFILGHGQYQWYGFIVEVGFCFSFFLASLRKG
jgi:Mg/Co/Ni transporter MgtE